MKRQILLYVQIDDFISDAALKNDTMLSKRHRNAQNLAIINLVFVLIINDNLDLWVNSKPLILS